MTKERLREYRDLKKELEQVRQKVEALEAALYAPKTQRLTGMPSSPPSGGNAVENLASKHMELLEYYRAKEKEMAAEQLAIERAIESLDYQERTLLRLYYIDGLTWEEACVVVHFSWTHVHRIHGNALKKLKDQEEAKE